MKQFLKILLLACLTILNVASALAGESSVATRSELDSIAFETRTWGTTASSWRVGKDGSGGWAQAERQPNAAFGDYELVYHDIAADKVDFARLQRILRRLPAQAPNPNECANMVTDMAYGTLRMTGGATTIEMAWNSGCLDDDYVAFMAILKEADELVAAAGRAGPETKRVKPKP